MVGLLLIFTLVMTTLYVATLIADLLRHRWGGALDASRDAVPAAVGWAALLIIFLGRGTSAAEQLMSGDHHAVSEKEKRAARNVESVRRAEQRVRDLAASLASLCAGVEVPGQAGHGAAAAPGPGRKLAREVAETTARLDQARQWLTSARAALAASQQDVGTATEKLTTGGFADPAERPGPAEGRVA
jgi:hypothetical protein